LTDLSLGQDLRAEFPALTQKVNGHSLVYLDSAASALKPKVVIDRIDQFYRFESSNVHRGAHKLSREATDHFEAARETTRVFIGAKLNEEVIFTRGATDSINLVAASYGELLNEGDEILLTEMEHHSNIVPWQMLALRKKLVVRFLPVLSNGTLDMEQLPKFLTTKTRLVAVVWTSNALGTVNDVERIIAAAHAQNAVLLVDAAQSVTHHAIDVQKLDCDFLVFSGHKLFGPTGVGVLYGKQALLNRMPPYQGGGAMISEVTTSGTTYNQLPFKFEAGTPHIAGVIGLAAAMNFVTSIGFEKIKRHHHEINRTCLDILRSQSDLNLYGLADLRAPIYSFNFNGLHASDVGSLFDQSGIAIRAGHHCTQPLWKRFGVTATARASFSIYNTLTDIEQFSMALNKLKEFT
jgi:cysteine desulfurase / selenocysteine lyase